MQFISKEFCKKLVDIQCHSYVNHVWVTDTSKNTIVLPTKPYDTTEYFNCLQEIVTAFSVLDFLSSEPYAIENCKRLFKDQMVGDLILAKERWMNDDYRPNWELKRIELLQTKDQVKFIEDAVNSL